MVDLSNVAALAARANQSFAPVEINFADYWRGRWEDEEPLPRDVPALHVYGVLLMDDKGYVVRERGEAGWGTLEGPAAVGEKPEAALVRVAKEQANATPARIDLIGYIDCRATSHNPDYPRGTRAVRPLYLFAAKQVKELGRQAAFERRRLPMNEYLMALRNRYPELEEYLGKAVERYMIARAKGEI